MIVTEQAQEQLKKALESFNKPGAGIHIFSTQGCCGPSIQMDISTHIGNGETAIALHGLDFYIANDLLDLIEKVTIEYSPTGYRLVGLEKGSQCCG